MFSNRLARAPLGVADREADRTCLPAATGLTVLLSLALPAAAECTQPKQPSLPDGASASLDEMLQGQKAVKEFQATNVDYMKCLEKHFSAAKEVAATATDDTARKKAASDYEAAIEAYNAAVSAEEEVAGAFNIELREFKAANR
jgi:hypothetical protein